MHIATLPLRPLTNTPLSGARRQAMVMAMLFGAGGIASAIYLSLQRPTETPGGLTTEDATGTE